MNIKIKCKIKSMKIKSNGPKMYPRSTPIFMIFRSESSLSILVDNIRSCRYISIK